MRRTPLLPLALVVLALGGCRFSTSRQLSPGDVRGRLVLQDAGAVSAVAGARVSVEGSRLWTRSDASGRFVLRGLVVGRHVLLVEADMDADGVVETGRRLRNVELAAVSDRVVSARDLGDVVLGATGGIEGTVKLGDDLAPGAEVVLDGLRGVRSVDGSFVFERLLPGEYTLSAAVGGDGGFRAVREVEVPVSARERTPAELRIEVSSPLLVKGRAQGRVLLPSGDPATGGEVLFQRDGAEPVTADVDVDGLFDTGEIEPGRYDVLARLEGFLDATIPGVLLGGEALELNDLVLAEAGASCGLPTTLDSDADGLGDACDTCPDVANPTQRPVEVSIEERPSAAGCTAATLSYTAPGPFQRGLAITALDPDVAGEGVLLGFSVSPALPDGLSLDPRTGRLSGTPTARADAATYTVTGANFLGAVTTTVTLLVRDLPPADLAYSPSPATFDLDQPITALAPTYSGGVPTTFTVSPDLPAGLVLDGVTGVISGTPSVPAESAEFVVTASNDGGFDAFTLTIAVRDTPPATLSYPSGTNRFFKGLAAAIDATWTGGATTRFTITPALPSTLTLDPVTGRIAGNADTLSPAANYVVRASNSGGFLETTVRLEIVDVPPASVTYPASPLVFVKGSLIATPFLPTFTGGAPTSYTFAGTRPAGLTFDAATGAIGGTPSTLQPATQYTITATNTGGSASTTVSITVNDVPPSNLRYVTPNPTYVLGQPITANVPLSNGGPVVSYTFTGAMPPGLSLQPGGAISGTPTAVRVPAVNLTITATNTGGSTSVPMAIRVEAPQPTRPQYASSVFNARKGTVFSALNQNPLPANHLGSYSINPALPAGLVLSPTNGHFSGTPTVAAPNANYTVTATSSGGSAETTVSLVVVDDPPVATIGASSGSVTRGNNLNFTYSLSDLEGPVSAEVRASTSTSVTTCAASGLLVATGLPAGTNVARAWSTTGVPLGTYRLCLSATDDSGQVTRLFSTAVAVLGPAGTLGKAGGDAQTVPLNGTPQPLIVQALNGATPVVGTPIRWSVTYPTSGGAITPTQTVTGATGASSFTAFPPLATTDVLTIVATAIEMQGAPSVSFSLTVGGDLVLDGTGGSTENGVAITTCGPGGSCNAANPFVLLAAKSYANVTLRNGARLTGADWTSGPYGPGNGVLQLQVSGILDVDATSDISMDGAGFRGGAKRTAGSTSAGAGVIQTSNNGPGGGGGASTGCAEGGAGGGGGGHATNGQNGVGQTSGAGGGPEGTPDLAMPSLGGGGGGGSGNLTSGNGFGGDGGGAIVISAGLVRLRGAIHTNGLAGDADTVDCDSGGGGGGAGGSLRIDATDLDLTGGSLLALGGSGGAGSGGQGPAANGGPGADGRIRVTLGSATPVVRTLRFDALPFAYLVAPPALDLTFDATNAELYGPSSLVALRVTNGSKVSIPALSTTGSVVVSTASDLRLRGALSVTQDLRVESANLYGPAWKSGAPSSSNGLLQLDVGGQFIVDVEGFVSMDGAGYSGGVSLAQGTGANGALGASGTAPNGAGGGGGSFSGCNVQEFFGGGGGGHATAGAAAPGPGAGQGGAAYGDADLTVSTLGAGGGGGAGELGGAGGGAIRIVAALFDNDGFISASGLPGGGSERPCTGGGGGGAGGSVRIETPGQVTGTGSVVASGGAGGMGSTAGGQGGDGYIRLVTTLPGAPGRALTVAGSWSPGVRVSTPVDVALTVDISGKADFPSLTRLASLTVNGGSVVVPGHQLTGNLAVANEVSRLDVKGPLTVGGNVSVTFGATLAGPAWVTGPPSETNGVLRIAATGSFTVESGSLVTMKGLGYRGGAPGVQGSSETASVGTASPLRNGSGGGAGSDALCATAGVEAGSGGGHGTPGGFPEVGPEPGAVAGTLDLVTISLGGGGGGGGTAPGAAFAGGHGGGGIFITAASMTINGGINANGLDGSGDANETFCTAGSGGGAGGAIRLGATGTISLGLGASVRAQGGAGGPGDAWGTFGGDGRIRIDATSVTGFDTVFVPFVGFCNGVPGRTGCGEPDPGQA